jgi:putative endonuclease
MDRTAYVYIVASGRNGPIYIGSTTNLVKRIWEHRNAVVDGFTKERNCHRLVWYEVHDDLEAARTRERQMKEWKRGWKLREIEGLNPEWDDLFDRIARP